jgi:hypothetical protein
MGLQEKPLTASESNRVGDVPRDLSQCIHRRLIGFLGLLLPVLLYVVAGLRPTEGLPNWVLLPSVSAYYYTGAGSVFVGVLFALSLFLFSYPGYKDVLADRVVGWLGGSAALGVALFPTAAPDGLAEPSWWSPGERVVHYLSAVLLFSAFILFAVWLFRKSSVPDKRNRPPEKRRRDAVCLTCGITMIGCVLWAASSLITQAPIFWPEAIAIVAFAISWLIKGQVHRPVLVAIRHLLAGPGSE